MDDLDKLRKELWDFADTLRLLKLRVEELERPWFPFWIFQKIKSLTNIK